MTGHISRGGKHSWELKFDIGRDPLTGKRRTRYVSFKGTKNEAKIELAHYRECFRRGYSIPTRPQVPNFWNAGNAIGRQATPAERHQERYRELIALYIKPNIGAARIQKLRPVHLNELYARLLREGGKGGRSLSPRTVGHVHRLLHRALGHAATWGVVSPVVSVVNPPKVPDTELTILTEEQTRSILRHLEGRTLRPIVSLLLGTGCRRGEVLALRWKDVDWDNSRIRIERSVEQTKKGGLKFKSPKTKNSRRNVAISPGCRPSCAPTTCASKSAGCRSAWDAPPTTRSYSPAGTDPLERLTGSRKNSAWQWTRSISTARSMPCATLTFRN